MKRKQAIGGRIAMTEPMSVDVRERLTAMRATRACMADWEIALGPAFARARPCMVKVVGVLAKSYPAPGTALRLVVRETANGYLAHPTGDFDHDCEDLRLTEKDLQMWALDWAKVEEAFGCQMSEIREPRSEGKVNSDRSTVSSTVGVAMSARERAKKVAAGRDRTVIRDRGDRKAIRVEVKRLLGLGLSQTEACRQVAEEVEKGRAGAHPLTTKYNLPGVSGAMVLRVLKTNW